MTETVSKLEECVVGLIRDDKVPVPAYPAIATLVVKTLRAPNYTLQSLIKILSQDNAVCAALLRYANAGAFGGKTPVSTLPAAVGRLGGNEVSRIAIATTLGAESAAAGPLVELRRKAWRESVISAHLAATIAPMRKLNEDDMFMAGLLHDFGKVLSIRAFEIALRRLDIADAFDVKTWDEIIERYHVELGMVLAVRWALPPNLSEVIARHHVYNIDGDFKETVSFIQCVDCAVRVIEDEGTVDPTMLAKTGLTPAEIAKVIDLLPRLATLVASFATPSPEPSAPAVTAPPLSLGSPQREVSVDAQITGAGSTGAEAVKVTHIGPAGLLCTAKSKLVSNQLARIKFTIPETTTLIDMWVTVQSPTTAAGYHAHELKPFAMPADLRDSFMRWVRQAAAEQPSAPPPLKQNATPVMRLALG